MPIAKFYRRLPILRKLYNRIDSAKQERDEAIGKLDIVLSERDTALSARDAALSQRDTALNERNSVISERDIVLSDRDAALRQRDTALNERNAAISERDAALRERDAAFLISKGAKLFVPPGHFHSPIVRPDDIKLLFQRSSTRDINDIRLNLDSQRQLFDDISINFADLPFTEQENDKNRYYYQNPNYSYGDGIMLYSMIRYYKPSHFMEIGSGFSSACALDTINSFMDETTHCTFIEPFPQLLEHFIKGIDKKRVTLISDIAQNVDKYLFIQLKEGDILSINSTHIIKTCSDVVFNILELLPMLQKGVIVHFHDIFYPFEYPYQWVMEDNRSWNELYLLRAFLMYNDSFEILFFSDYFVKKNHELIAKRCPLFLKNTGGSLWMKKIK